MQSSQDIQSVKRRRDDELNRNNEQIRKEWRVDEVKRCQKSVHVIKSGSHRIVESLVSICETPQKPGGVLSPRRTMLITLYFVPISSGDANRTMD